MRAGEREMEGGKDLERLFANLDPCCDPELYVFATVPEDAVPAGLRPRMLLREEEGVTLVLPRAEAEALGLAHGFPCRRITLAVHSALDAVGFLARIATALAARGLPVNPVAGVFHDHLFVPDGCEREAMAVLHELARTAAGKR